MSSKTAGNIALIALAKLDILTLISSEKWDSKTRRRIRYIINVANNDIKALTVNNVRKAKSAY